jgi:hypothetical protein
VGKKSQKAKMGRPAVMQQPCNVVLWLERPESEKAKEVAANKGMSLSEVMRRLLREFVEREKREGKSNAA